MRMTLPLFLVPMAVSAPAVAVENVPVPAFQSLQLRGGGEIEIRPGPVQRVTVVDGSTQFTNIRVKEEGKLEIDACNARCPQHYRLRIVVETPKVPVLAVQGGGSISAAPGFAEQRELTLAVGGGGVIDTRAVPSPIVTAAVSGGGKINVRPQRVLTAAVNGGGEIRYWGRPDVTTAINGGGVVGPGS